MKNTSYQNLKETIKRQADKLPTNDKPFRRQTLNDLLDSLIRQIDFALMRENITDKRPG